MDVYMKINRGYVDMKGTFSIKDSSERKKKISQTPVSHLCGKFVLFKDFIGGHWFAPKSEKPYAQ